MYIIIKPLFNILIKSGFHCLALFTLSICWPSSAKLKTVLSICMHLLGAEALYCAGHRVNRMLECKENTFFKAFITHKC